MAPNYKIIWCEIDFSCLWHFNSAPNKNTFPGVKYNGLLSGTVQRRQQQIALLRQDFLAYTFTLLLEFSPSYRPLWNPISLSLICAMIYSCLSLGCGNMLMVYNANFDKTALSLTKKGTSIFRVYYAISLCMMNMAVIDYNWCMSKYHDISILYQGKATVIFVYK